MSPSENRSTERIEAVLVAETSRLTDLLDRLQDELTETDADGIDGGGEGRDPEDRAALARLIGRRQVDLDEVDAALKRLAAGIYGTCESCGCRIPAERLDAIPEARRCVCCLVAPGTGPDRLLRVRPGRSVAGGSRSDVGPTGGAPCRC
ncbi:MAG TPA: TraR/DksA family transcriptional regulator [Acidimicrobiales bacterium]|nr:TraR/DksA family transcriptional regulator [Acidimicrobiales bacterium]